MRERKVEEIKMKRICSSCVCERQLSEENSERDRRRKCSHCGHDANSCSVGRIAERVDTAFGQHCIPWCSGPEGFIHSAAGEVHTQ